MITSFSGRYLYLCNGEDSGVEESWSLIDNNGHRHIEALRHARPYGISLKVSSEQDGREFSRCLVRWEGDNGSSRAQADYQFNNGILDVYQEFNGKGRHITELPVDFIFSALMRIYNGPVITQLAEAATEHRVCVPCISAQAQREELLLPLFSQRRAQRLEDTTLLVDGAERPCTRYEYHGGEYAPGTHFWIDKHGVMLRYCWQENTTTLWDVTLQDYLGAG